MKLFKDMNKEEAEKFYDFIQSVTAITNHIKLSPDIGSNNEAADALSLNMAFGKAIANSLARYW